MDCSRCEALIAENTQLREIIANLGKIAEAAKILEAAKQEDLRDVAERVEVMRAGIKEVTDENIKLIDENSALRKEINHLKAEGFKN